MAGLAHTTTAVEGVIELLASVLIWRDVGDVEEEQRAYGECFVDLWNWLEEPGDILEPDREETEDGEEWDEPNDPHNLLLLLGIRPVQQMTSRVEYRYKDGQNGADASTEYQQFVEFCALGSASSLLASTLVRLCNSSAPGRMPL